MIGTPEEGRREIAEVGDKRESNRIGDPIGEDFDGRQSRHMAGEDFRTQNDARGCVSEQAKSLATFVADNMEVPPPRVQGTVERWIEQGRELALPLHYYEPTVHMANNVKPQANKKQPGGLRNFFTRMMKALEPTAILDSGATGNFNEEGVGTPTGETSSKIVGMQNRQMIRATRQVELPLPKLKPEARRSDELPGLHSTLVSIPLLANNGYVSIFKAGNEGAEVYRKEDAEIVAKGDPVLSGWRDSWNGLWRISMHDAHAPDPLDCAEEHIQLPSY